MNIVPASHNECYIETEGGKIFVVRDPQNKDGEIEVAKVDNSRYFNPKRLDMVVKTNAGLNQENIGEYRNVVLF